MVVGFGQVANPDIELELAEGAKHEAELSARFAFLDLDEPLPADSDSARELRLIQSALDAALANRQADVLWCPDAHRWLS